MDKCGVLPSGAPAGAPRPGDLPGLRGESTAAGSSRPKLIRRGLLHLSEGGIKDGQDQRRTRWWTARREPRPDLGIRSTAYDSEAKRRSDFLL